MQRNVFLVFARKKKKQREKQYQTANKQYHSEQNLWSFNSSVQQQQLNDVKANMASPHTTSPLLFLSSFLSHMTPNTSPPLGRTL